jgi:hypothetical protein
MRPGDDEGRRSHRGGPRRRPRRRSPQLAARGLARQHAQLLPGAAQARADATRALAERWIPALMVLGGLVTAAIVVGSQEQLRRLAELERVLVAVLVAFTFAAFAYSVWRAYRVALAIPLSSGRRVDRLTVARRAEQSLERGLLKALIAVFAGLGCVLLALNIIWFGRQSPAVSGGVSNCVLDVRDSLVAQFPGTSMPVESTVALHGILVQAYDDEVEALDLAARAGLRKADIARYAQLRYTWWSILEVSAREDRLRSLVDKALDDRASAAWHNDLRSVMAKAAPPASPTYGSARTERDRGYEIRECF